MAVDVIAHRACPRHGPENSLAGIATAAELGADAVEIDVRATIGGTAVVVHDLVPWRTARLPLAVGLLPRRWVVGRPLRGSDARIPTLRAALDALPDALGVVLDIKAVAAAHPAVRDVRRCGVERRTRLWSSLTAAVRILVREAPDIEVALLRETASSAEHGRFLDDAVALGAGAVCAGWDAVTPAFVAAAHDRGLRVYAGDPGAGEGVREKAAAGIDGFTTDWPLEARQALRA